MNWEQNHRAHSTYKDIDYVVATDDIEFKLKSR